MLPWVHSLPAVEGAELLVAVAGAPILQEEAVEVVVVAEEGEAADAAVAVLVHETDLGEVHELAAAHVVGNAAAAVDGDGEEAVGVAEAVGAGDDVAVAVGADEEIGDVAADGACAGVCWDAVIQEALSAAGRASCGPGLEPDTVHNVSTAEAGTSVVHLEQFVQLGHLGSVDNCLLALSTVHLGTCMVQPCGYTGGAPCHQHSVSHCHTLSGHC